MGSLLKFCVLLSFNVPLAFVGLHAYFPCFIQMTMLVINSYFFAIVNKFHKKSKATKALVRLSLRSDFMVW